MENNKKKVAAALEEQLARDPHYAPLVIALREVRGVTKLESAGQKILEQVGEMIKTQTDHLAEVEETVRDTGERALGKFANELHTVGKTLSELRNRDESKQIAGLAGIKAAVDALAKKEIPAPVVNVQAPPAPIVNVPEPVVIDKTVTIQETKFAERMAKALDDLLRAVKDQRPNERTKITNSETRDAIPVVIVSRDGKRRMDLSDIQQFMATGSGGGVRQYHEGDASADIEGVAMLWEDDNNTLRVPSRSKPIPVSVHAPATLLTPASPTAATVAATSGVAFAADPNRRAGTFINTSNYVISLGLGATAVLRSGITLMPNGGSWKMTGDEVTALDIHAIASAAGANLAFQAWS